MTLSEGFRSVVIDCDSTLVTVEGIDLLAGSHAKEVAEMTERAMTGEVPLEAVYGARLDLIRPPRDRLAWLGARYVETLVPHARETVAALSWLGKEVRIMSGGLLPSLRAVADELGLDAAAVWGVDIRFDDRGGYAGFDEESPLARAGGKAEMLASSDLPRRRLMVGDGATDLEAAAAADAFVAFAGVAYRPEVSAGADETIHSPSLAPLLAIACDAEDRRRLGTSRWAPLLDVADRFRTPQVT